MWFLCILCGLIFEDGDKDQDIPHDACRKRGAAGASKNLFSGL